MLHNLLHSLVRSIEISLHNTSLVHENKGGASLGGIAGMVAGVTLATTPVGWGIAIIIGSGGGALVEKGVKRLIEFNSKSK